MAFCAPISRLSLLLKPCFITILSNLLNIFLEGESDPENVGWRIRRRQKDARIRGLPAVLRIRRSDSVVNCGSITGSGLGPCALLERYLVAQPKFFHRIAYYLMFCIKTQKYGNYINF